MTRGSREPCAVCGKPVSLSTCEWVDAPHPEQNCPKPKRGAPRRRGPSDFYGRCRKIEHHNGQCRYTGEFEPIYIRDPAHESCLPVPWHLPEKDRPRQEVS